MMATDKRRTQADDNFWSTTTEGDKPPKPPQEEIRLPPRVLPKDRKEPEPAIEPPDPEALYRLAARCVILLTFLTVCDYATAFLRVVWFLIKND